MTYDSDAFRTELLALCRKHRVRLVPVPEDYGGSASLDVETTTKPKWNSKRWVDNLGEGFGGEEIGTDVAESDRSE